MTKEEYLREKEVLALESIASTLKDILIVLQNQEESEEK